MFLKNIFFLFLATLVFTSCKVSSKKGEQEQDETLVETDSIVSDPIIEEKIQAISESYLKDEFLSNGLVTFDFMLFKGDEIKINAKFTMLTDLTQIRLDYNDGSSAWFIDRHIVTTPSITHDARFDILTWSYFFALPYKLKDQGTIISALPLKKVDDTQYDPIQLTFQENVGDTPNDWYILYPNAENGLLDFVVYIVTYGGKEVGIAEENLHAIRYNNYIYKNAIPFAQVWSFHNWTDENGLGDQNSRAVISNVSFPNADEETFNIPENVVQITDTEE